MTLAKRKFSGTKKRIINIGGDDIRILHVGFEVSETGWDLFKVKMKEKYGDDWQRKKSEAMRILVNAINLKIVDLSDLEKKCMKQAEDVKDIIYI